MLKCVLNTVSKFTCRRCITYLTYVFGAGKDEIMIGDLPTTPQSFLTSLSSAASIEANAVGPIEFIGGPPGNIKRYKGTLVTLLQDYILYAVATNNTEQLLKIRDSNLVT